MSDQFSSPAPEPRPEKGPADGGYGQPSQPGQPHQGYGPGGDHAGGYAPSGYQDGTSLMSPADQRTWGALAHLSGIVSSVLGGLAPLLPIVAYFVLRDRGSFIRHHTAEAANFHLSIFLYVAAFFVLTVVTLGIGVLIAIPAWIVLGIWWLVGSIMAAIKAKDGEQWRIPLTWHVFN